MNTVAQPVLLLSGILLPLAVRAGLAAERVADWNPFAWAVDGTRALFAGDLGDDKVWQGLLIIGACSPWPRSSGRPASSPAASASLWWILDASGAMARTSRSTMVRAWS